MGVYSDNRVFGSFVEAPEPDLSYNGVEGMNRIMAEMVQDDLILFENIIVNDIQQAYCQRAINEGYAEYEYKLISLQEAAAGGIFAKIGAFLKKIWAKISGWFKNFFSRFAYMMADNKSLVSKYKKRIDSKGRLLDDMEYKWCERNNESYKKDLLTDHSKAEDAKNKIISKFLNGDYEVKTHFSVDNDGNSAPDDDVLKRFIESLEEDKDATIADIYNAYIGSGVEAGMDKASLSKVIHEFFFNEEQEEKNFLSRRSEIEKTLSDSNKTINNLKKQETTINKYFTKEIDELHKLESKWNGSSGKAIDNLVNIGTGEGQEKKYNDLSKNSRYVSNYASKCANAVSKYYSLLQTCVVDLLNQQVEAEKFYIKQCRRVYTQALNYNSKSSKNEATLFEAIGEAAEFEIDMLLSEAR